MEGPVNDFPKDAQQKCIWAPYYWPTIRRNHHICHGIYKLSYFSPRWGGLRRTLYMYIYIIKCTALDWHHLPLVEGSPRAHQNQGPISCACDTIGEICCTWSVLLSIMFFLLLFNSLFFRKLLHWQIKTSRNTHEIVSSWLLRLNKHPFLIPLQECHWIMLCYAVLYRTELLNLAVNPWSYRLSGNNNLEIVWNW